MQIECPNCKARYSFDEGRVGEAGVKLRCSKCQVVFRIMRRAASPEPAAKEVPQAPSVPRINVLVANESPAFCSAIRKVLASEPFDVVAYNDGREAMTAIEVERPPIVILDVALPSMYGFEICETVRRNPALDAVKLILVASIYDKTKYKRSPQSLYGADAYIEKHHIPDSLAALIYRLVGGQRPMDRLIDVPSAPAGLVHGVTAPQSDGDRQAEEAARNNLRREEERETSAAACMPVSGAGDVLPEFHVKARRLARIIVSDILLYNQAKAEEGIRNGTFFDLLKDDIQEGRSLYARRVPQEILHSASYLDEAFDQLIARKREEMNL